VHEITVCLSKALSIEALGRPGHQQWHNTFTEGPWTNYIDGPISLLNSRKNIIQ